MACSSGCLTPGEHKTYGECLRGKNLKHAVSIPGTGYDRAREKKWESRLDSYRDARAQGIQPATTKSSDIKAAVQYSDTTGNAFVAH